MPLLDPFHPPLNSERRWESFHSSWATRIANLHNEILELMGGADSLRLSPESSLYAVAYRPLRRGKEDVIDVWRSPLALGRTLPTLPLGLRADLVIPVDFEETYAEACHRKRLTGS